MMKPLSFTQEELDKIHQIQIQMLAEVDRICRKHHINYFVSGGTLLGAVRNHKIIPWDDDIDVRMLRSEYERFRNVCNSEIDKNKFFFQDHTTDPGYPWYYGKIRYIHSHYVRVGQEHLNMQDGIFIDILYSDGVPDNVIERAFVTRICWMLKKCLYSVVGAEIEPNPVKKAGYKLMNKLPKKAIFSALDSISKRYASEKYQDMASYAFVRPGQKVFLKRSWHTELIETKFEGMNIFITKNYHEWLVMAYGEDYMTPPPLENRVVHNEISNYSIEEEL